MSLENTEPNVLGYDNLRNFLNDYYYEKKLKNKYWSISQWSKKIGLSTKSSLSMVLNGDRNVGTDMAGKMIRYFDFADNEKIHFMDLVNKRDTKVSNTLKVKMSLTETAEQDEANDSIFLNYKTYILRELVSLKNFREDPQWVKDYLWPNMEIEEIENIFEELEKSHAIKRNRHGKLQQQNCEIVLNNKLSRESVTNIQNDFLNLTKSALEYGPTKGISLHTNTYCIKEKDIEKFHDLIDDFTKKLATLSAKAKGDSLYQMNLHFFRLNKDESNREQ